MKEILLPVFLDVDAGPRSVFLGDVFGFGATPEHVSEMTPLEFSREVMEYASTGIPVGLPLFATIVGSVKEDDLRHVVVRASVERLHVLRVMTVKQHEGKWMIMPGAEVVAAGQLLDTDADYYRSRVPR